MTKVITVEELPFGEKVYLKKDIFGYRVVEPIKDPENGKFIWRNFFNPRGFVMLFVLLLIFGVGYLAFKEQLTNYKQVLSNPCSYCVNCKEYIPNIYKDNFVKDINSLSINFNLSE